MRLEPPVRASVVARPPAFRLPPTVRVWVLKVVVPAVLTVVLRKSTGPEPVVVSVLGALKFRKPRASVPVPFIFTVELAVTATYVPAM